MEHHFDIEIAQKYGVHEAIFIHHLYWWIAKNEANGRHYYEGRNWTYNSMEAFAKLLPYWNAGQIRRLIKSMENNGLLFVGNFNNNQFDRTQWYALSDEILKIYRKEDGCVESETSMCRKRQMDSSKSSNGCDENGTAIPVNKQNNKPVINNPPISPQSEIGIKEIFLSGTNGMSNYLVGNINDWIRFKKEKGQGYKPTGLKKLLSEIKNMADKKGDGYVSDCISKSMANNYQGITWKDWGGDTKPKSKSFMDICREEYGGFIND